MRLRPIHIGDTDDGQPIVLTPDQRSTGTQIIGAPGSGKSQLANHMIEQDLRYLPGGGLVIDPHGNDPSSLYQSAFLTAARYRPRRPMYFVNLSFPRFVYGFHAFAPRPGIDVSTRVQRGVRLVFSSWGEADPYERPRALHWLTNTFSVGMERGDVGLTELRAMLDHDQSALRTHLSSNTTVATSWATLNQKRLDHFDEQIESTRNRLDALVRAAGPRRFLSLIHPTAMLDFREILARRAWVFVNLQASPFLDREHARVLGSLLIGDFIDLACQRPTQHGRPPAPVALYIDEAHLYVNRDLAVVFEEGRKFQIFTTLLHQHMQQLRQEDERVYHAVLSAARTKIIFALGSDVDAKQMVHEVFVGDQGVDYAEVKRVQPQTKFRPIASRDRTVSHTLGGSRGHSVAAGRAFSRGRTYTTGRGQTHTDGHNTATATAKTLGSSSSIGKARTRSVGNTHTVGRSTTMSVADGTSEADSFNESHTAGTSRTRGYSRNRGRTYTATNTTSRAITTTESPDGELTRTQTESSTDAYSWSDGDASSDAETAAESVTRGRSHATGRNHVDTYAEGHSESDARMWSQADTKSTSQTHSQSRTETDSDGWSESDADTRSENEADSTGTTDSKTWSRSNSRNWGKTISDAPVTRYEEFREDSVDLYSLEEQRQRLADTLRVPPQRKCIVRRPDCTHVQVTVPVRKPVRLSDGLVSAREALFARETGAIFPDEADAHIAERWQRVQEEAREFAGRHTQPVHSKEYELRRPAPNTGRKLTPRRPKAPAEGTKRSKG